ncbi:MAG: hypothetical protein KME35_06390 [Aphanocapsa sp. GSE-SYN-MK-11-07L]|nr:hypothetical protein [Aphanocapsa sp. GSE-SYN-MK-11-07L]
MIEFSPNEQSTNTWFRYQFWHYRAANIFNPTVLFSGYRQPLPQHQPTLSVRCNSVVLPRLKREF